METVLGVSMAPAAVRMVLVEGENGDGATVDEDKFDVAADQDPLPISAADRVISAILGTLEGAAEGGFQVTSTGVTWTDPIEAAALRDALAAHKIENVMLVSAFLAAAALTQAVGNETNYARTALLFVEPDTATLAIVDTSDGSIADVHRQALPEDDDTAVAQLATMVSGAEALETRPDAVFVVGAGIDIPMIKPALEAATSLPLTVPEEPDTALARGAALASANAPLFVSSTAARAYAQDPFTGAVDPFAIAPGYFEVPESGDDALAYSAVPDDFADAYTGEHTAATSFIGAGHREWRSFGLVGSVFAAIFIVGVAALVVSLAIAIRPTAGVRPGPGHNIVAPAQPAPAAPAPVPAAPVPAAPAPAAVPEAPAPAPVPVPAAPVPAVIPVPVLEGPAPAPVAPPLPIPLPIPPILGGPGGPFPGGPFGPGGGGFPGGPGHGGGGFPGGPGHDDGGFPGGPGHGGFGGGHGGFGGGHGGFGGGHGGFGGGHGGFGHR
jgi:hypothetical protein